MAKEAIFDDLDLVLQVNQHIEAVVVEEKLQHESSFRFLNQLDAMNAHEARVEALFEHQRCDFEPQDGPHIPFHLQGDESFNDAVLLATRRALRKSNEIMEKVEFLWNVSLSKKEAQHRQATDKKVEKATSMMEKEYVELMLLVFKALRDDFDLEMATSQVQCDWEVDTQKQGLLSFELFFASIFELVDLWTCDVLKDTYVRFLDLLTKRITLRVVVFLNDQRLELALSDNFEEATVVKAIPLGTIKQFATVAKVVAPRGVHTIGELAMADPKMVEEARKEYIGIQPLSPKKIGEELQHLLDMFKMLTNEYLHMDYVMKNTLLIPRPLGGTKAEGEGYGAGNGGMHSRDGFEELNSGDIDRIASSCIGMTGSGTNGHEAESGGGMASTAGESGAGQRAGESVAGLASTASLQGMKNPGRPNGNLDSDPRSGHKRDASTHHAVNRDGNFTDASNTNPMSSSMSYETSGEGAVDEFGQSIKHNTEDRPSGRYLRRLSTIHDLSIADPSTINGFRVAFLLEKEISLERVTDIDAIRAELVKFGIDPTGMSDIAARERYNSLYETLVVRDGESVKLLAKSLLEQIKIELAAHGIYVEDAELEPAYGRLFDTLMNKSGEQIVDDARQWVDQTLDTKQCSAYIKDDRYELKAVEDVKPFGSDEGDEEFMTLLNEDIEDEEENKEGKEGKEGKEDKVEIEKSVLPSYSQSTIRRRPSQTMLKCNDEADKSNFETSDMSSENAADIVSGLEHLAAEDSGDNATVYEQRVDLLDIAAGPAKEHILEAVFAVDESASFGISCGDEHSAEDDDPRIPDDLHKVVEQDTGNLQEDSDEPVDNSKAHDGHPDTDESPKDDVDTAEIRPPEPLSKERIVAQKRWRRVIGVTRLSRSIVSHDEKHSRTDSIDNAQDREAIGLRFGLEQVGEVNEGVIKERSLTPMQREPKVPVIVMGGVAGAPNVSSTGRYLNLLGMGEVVVLPEEEELFAYLTSDKGSSVDLVCFDVGINIGEATTILLDLQEVKGKCIILVGGNPLQVSKTEAVVAECLELGALYFAIVPVNFTSLRAQILAFFEQSPHPYILRHRKKTLFKAVVQEVASSSSGIADILSVPRGSMSSPQSTLTGVTRQIKRKTTMFNNTFPPVPRPAPRQMELNVHRATGPMTTMRPSPSAPHSLKSHKKSPRMLAAIRSMMS